MSDVPSILIVDDEPVARSRLRELLADLAPDFPHRIVGEAPNAPEALSQIEVAQPQIVLLDIGMPRMNGYDAARGIRALKRPDASTVRIVAMTADAFSEDIQRAREAGMDGHVAKPVDARSLFATLSGREPDAS